MSYVLTDKDQKTYSDCYGVEVKYNNGKFNYSGSAEQVSKVSGMVNKNKFLKENGPRTSSDSTNHNGKIFYFFLTHFIFF